MRKSLSVAAVLFFTAATNIFAQRISGTVTDSVGNPIARASITEVDVNHRILSSTRTDAAGNFNINLRNVGETRLRINASGFAMYTERSKKGQLQKFVMRPRTASRLSQLIKAHAGEKQNYVLTEKLLCGHNGSGSDVPWMVMVEQIGDSTYVLRVPVKASSNDALYTEGRSITFVDWGDAQLLASFNGEDAPSVSGHPNERGTWKSVAINEHGLTEMRHALVNADNDYTELYFYPSFILTADEMQHLILEADHFGRLLIDNEEADNYWIMYPRNNFTKELQKVLKKLSDNAKKR